MMMTVNRLQAKIARIRAMRQQKRELAGTDPATALTMSVSMKLEEEQQLQ